MLVISAGKNEIFDFALPMGVGLVDMAINLTKFLQKRACIGADENGINLKNIDPHYFAKIEAKFANSSNPELKDISQNLSKNPERNLYKMPEKIVFVGSAGLYKDGEILQIYESSVGANIEISSVENRSYSPIECEISSIVSRGTIKINSSNFITTDKNLAHKIFEKGYFLENMEFFSVLRVAQIFKIPAYGIFVATNFCDKNAHADFIKNHAEAKKILTKYIKENM
ncbi:purine-nucleoside phosphorylase [Campylobacter concisus]|uniref:purine-nucleoside phosphorylase n=1 Tax=Campylobacter concisus TaxID=199 RepID=UPI000CD90119|nr:purine-nucleoside phosphorylase [Campylobacter concisus]